ncbi:heavy-metal-associated domain-containing protein [Ornithinibacillus scapharcae]|uniref:heavy-metal-associated domain-containing protein n=1 Tax=Ornithinibacillus scapharcae TaxID=1147159 RepID=UPI000225BACD|nr:heavy metal-associated domain-containing protein [Ornithinibacillus scapharcae]
MVEKIYLEITGLHCPNCPGKIERAISKFNGVKDISVDSSGNGFVSFSSQLITFTEIQEKIQKMGFETKIKQNSIN